MEMFIWQTNDYTSCTNSTNFRRTGVTFCNQRRKSYQHRKRWKYQKKRVIHEVINVIHRKKAKIIGLHSKKREQRFCTQIIKLISLSKKGEKILTFLKWKYYKSYQKMSKMFQKYTDEFCLWTGKVEIWPWFCYTHVYYLEKQK